MKHERSTKINTKEINFNRYNKTSEGLKIIEEKGLFPQRFIVIVTKKSGYNIDLNTHITITLHKNEEEKSCNVLLSRIMNAILNTPEGEMASRTGILTIRVKTS